MTQESVKYRVKFDNDYLDLPSCNPSPSLCYIIDGIMHGSDWENEAQGIIDPGTLDAVITHIPSFIVNAFRNDTIGKLIIKYDSGKCITIDTYVKTIDFSNLSITFRLTGGPQYSSCE